MFSFRFSLILGRYLYILTSLKFDPQLKILKCKNKIGEVSLQSGACAWR